MKSAWWYIRTAITLCRFRPDALMYAEPHSAPAAWLYCWQLRGRARLFIHHHEYYEDKDYWRSGMRLPRLGRWMEKAFLFGRAEWISQTNEDRLRLARVDFPQVSDAVWHVLPNYPPADWAPLPVRREREAGEPLRLVYVGSASFEDTYIREVVLWAPAHPDRVTLHLIKMYSRQVCQG